METPPRADVTRNGVRRPPKPVVVPHAWAVGERITHDAQGLGTVVRVEATSVLVDFGEGANAVRRVKKDDDRLKPL
ncbi:MAG TPA: hypothetical protein VLV82_03905 [Candidatus Angelobacter sp.]|nr:hypothetical protein [Candidatus Angelobacter sp.]